MELGEVLIDRARRLIDHAHQALRTARPHPRKLGSEGGDTTLNLLFAFFGQGRLGSRPEGLDYAYLVYPHKPIVAYLPQTGVLLNEYCVEFPDETRPYGSPRLPDSDDVLAKWMAINGDEGEPGTFKDRYYLERDPHRFLEGMLIAAWAVQASEIYIYLRDEYHGCREILETEITHNSPMPKRQWPLSCPPSTPSAPRPTSLRGLPSSAWSPPTPRPSSG